MKIKLSLPDRRWEKIIDSSSREWEGDESLSDEKIESKGSEAVISIFVLYRKIKEE